MKKFILLVAALGLAACQNNQNAVVQGQLFCAMSTGTGPLVVALADTSGVPVTVTNKASDVVAKACAVIGAIPVVPPADPTEAPVVAAHVSP